MTPFRNPEHPLITRIVLLADESAHFVVAGLSQLDRAFRTLEECFAPGLDQATAPELIVLWKSLHLQAQRPSRFTVVHRVAGPPVPADPAGGTTLLLSTSVIFHRKALRRLLGTSGAIGGLALLGPAEMSGGWQDLVSRIPAAGDDSAWTLASASQIPEVQRRLLRTTGKPTDGLVARTLNRPISQLVSRWLVQTRVTPNQVSFLVLSVLAASTWILSWGTPQGFVIGMLLFHLASVLDGCDGEIARAKFQESRLGAWLDTSVDLAGNCLMVLALALGLSRQPGLSAAMRNNYLLEGILIAAGIAIGVAGIARARPRGRADFNDFGSSAVARFQLPRPLTAVVQTVVHLLRRDSYALLFVVLAVVGKPEWILHGLAIAVALHFPVIAWSLWSQARMGARQRAADRP